MRNYEINIPSFDGFLKQVAETKDNELNKSDVLSSLPSDELIEKIARKAIEKLYGSPNWETDSNAQNRFEGIKYGLVIGREFMRRQIA